MYSKLYNKGDATPWVIAAVAVVALIIGWMAFNRTDDASQMMDDQNNEMQQEDTQQMSDEDRAEAAQGAARAEAATKLATLRAQAEAGELSADAAAQVEDIKANLAVAYENAQGQAAQSWTEISAGFDSLADDIRNGTGDVLQGFANLSLLLEADVRSDQQ